LPQKVFAASCWRKMQVARLHDEWVNMRAYYTLEDVNFEFFPQREPYVHGFYRLNGRTIGIVEEDYDDDRELSYGILVLLHEIKHALQDKEKYIRIRSRANIEIEAYQWSKEQYCFLGYPGRFEKHINAHRLVCWDMKLHLWRNRAED